LPRKIVDIVGLKGLDVRHSYDDIRTDLGMEPIEYELRYYRWHAWNVVDAFWVPLRAVTETASAGPESPALLLHGVGGERADWN
jgi:hypothetical protein